MELPKHFVEQICSLLGKDETNCLLNALDEEKPVSIRLNPLKAAPLLPIGSQFSPSPVPWCAQGVYLNQRATFTFDPLFHAGCYYVQEAGSMFLEQALKQYVGNEPVIALDLCAAPGGKSTHIRSLLPEGSLLVANEVMRNRSQILAENLTKWGHPNVVVSNNDPADFAQLTGFFNLIVADVPCSGEGMFRKDPTAVSEWSVENVELCRLRQRRILSDIWPCLKPGGLLIYSTCTYNTMENEENVDWICRELGAEPLPIDVPKAWNITGSLLPSEALPVYRFLPHKTQAEGFFLAALRKHEDADSLPAPSRKMKEQRKPGKGKEKSASTTDKVKLKELQEWLHAPDAYELQTEENIIYAFPQRYRAELQALRSCLHLLQAGVEMAEVKGRDLVPCHSLAVSTLLAKDAFPHAEVDYPQAIAYLRKETVVLPPDSPRGFVLLTYRGTPLGFVKNVGNRANNLYPSEWRIRSSYLPEEIKVL